jgi:hypothetical protein
MLGFFAFQREATLHGMQGPSKNSPMSARQQSCKSIRRNTEIDKYICLHLSAFVCIYLHLSAFGLLQGALWPLALWLPKNRDYSFPAVNANGFTATYKGLGCTFLT